MSTFPDPRYARSDVVAMGEDLRVETLREAYRKGIFPWPHDELPLPWFSPRRRAVIFFDELHVGRSLRKAQNRARIQDGASVRARRPATDCRARSAAMAVSHRRSECW